MERIFSWIITLKKISQDEMSDSRDTVIVMAIETKMVSRDVDFTRLMYVWINNWGQYNQ